MYMSNSTAISLFELSSHTIVPTLLSEVKVPMDDHRTHIHKLKASPRMWGGGQGPRPLGVG